MSSLLFSSMFLGSLFVPNRIVIPPMCQYSAENGLAGDWHLIHYGSLAASGAGMLIIEATAVSPEGRISPDDLGLWDDDTEQALGRLLAAIRRYSAIPVCLQLAHAGRKASQYAPWIKDDVMLESEGGWEPVAPSALAYEQSAGQGVTPRAMDLEDCEGIRRAFADAAARAARIGFDAVEVHAAHGYLLHEFLSPLSNKRDDCYGGKLEHRMRYPLEIFDAVREAFPEDKPVGIRISATDWAKGGWNLDESCDFAVEVQQRGGAYIHVSGGGLTPRQKIQVGPGYQASLAATVKNRLAAVARESGGEPMPVIGVGLITEPEQAEAMLVSGQADMVAVGRRILYNPRWPWHAAAKLGQAVDAPPQYWRSAPHGSKGLFRK